MVDNNDDDFDQHDDFDAGFDLEEDDVDLGGGGEKLSLKEVWESNPLLKVAAAVLAFAMAAGVYMTFLGADPAEDIASRTRIRVANVDDTPGQSELSEEYEKALQEQNQKAADLAMQTGSSAIPAPTGSAAADGIQVNAVSNEGEKDPLQEWRRRVEQAREVDLGADLEDEEILAPQPDLVPIVKPVTPQPVQKLDPKVTQALVQQMRTIVSAQAPEKAHYKNVTDIKSPYNLMIEELKEAEKAAADGSRSGLVLTKSGHLVDADSPEADHHVIVPAGKIVYAQTLTELNSDIPGPALATILSGPFRGGRALGEMSVEDDFIVITFSRIVKDDVIYSIDGIALDETTTLPAHQTDIDHHYFARIVLPAASKFLEGYTESLAETGTTTTTTAGGGVATGTPEPSNRESLYDGLTEASGVVSEILTEDKPDGPTIKVARGTTMGILFLNSVTTGDAN
ncbi:MAG: hypothetical protein OXT65_02165 [Alphaproteobacteria bacterium]|nr:hypothetical protein [Alphaproteobacteria bacterium]